MSDDLENRESRLSNDAFLRKARLLLGTGRECVVNSDLDGVVSAALLQAAADWRVVGWCDCRGRSSDRLWLDRSLANLQDVVFVDIHVNGLNVSSLDQHFVAYDERMGESIMNNPLKINPNHASISRSRFGIEMYRRKYPFGTAHTVLALIERLSLNCGFDLNARLEGVPTAPRAGDLLLRCDDTLANTLKYPVNAQEWWTWLTELGGSNTRRLATNIEKRLSTRTEIGSSFYRRLSEAFSVAGGRPSNRDGWTDYSHLDFSSAFDDGVLNSSTSELLVAMFELFGCTNPKFPDRYRTISASEGSRVTWGEAPQVASRSDVFSYAFVAAREPGFSYTAFSLEEFGL